MSKVRIKVKDVIDSGVSYSYMLLMQTFDEKTIFPIFISNKDADSFIEVIKDIHFKRPQTHVLLMDFFDRFGVKVQEVYIHKLQEGVFYSTIYCAQNGEVHEFDARPSDSIILALKSDAPVYIHSDIIENVGRPSQEVIKELSIQEDISEEDYFPNDDHEDIEVNTDAFSNEELEAMLEDVVSVEDYETASKIRDILLTRKKQAGETE